MKLSQFKFKLPEEKIALHPTKYRDESRLMVLHKRTGEIEHKMFKDILNYFDDKDVFVFNDTKVFPARLYGNKEKTGARIEVFLLRELNEELRLLIILFSISFTSIRYLNILLIYPFRELCRIQTLLLLDVSHTGTYQPGQVRPALQSLSDVTCQCTNVSPLAANHPYFNFR